MPKLTVTMRKVSDLIPYEGNAKKHPELQVEQIAESIRQFGFNDPVAVDAAGVVIEGHGRLMAAKLLGIDEVPVIELSHLTDEQRRAYTLVHNQTTMSSGFDLDVLQAELDSIIDIDMGDFGFDIDLDSRVVEKPSAAELDEVDLGDRLEAVERVYWSFSGGRDSTLALMATYKAFADAGKKCKVLYVDNGCEFPDVIMHVRRVCKQLGAELAVIKPDYNFLTEYVDKGQFPDPVFMDCVERLINRPIDEYIAQDAPDEDYILVRGGKKSQKTSRSKTDRLQTVKGKPHMTIYNPAYDYDEEQLSAELPEWAGYSRGFDRTACWCCPFQRKKQWDALKENYPLLWDETKRMFETMQYKRIDGDGHPKYVVDYWQNEHGVKPRWR